jgi:hypothetical protein
MKEPRQKGGLIWAREAAGTSGTDRGLRTFQSAVIFVGLPSITRGYTSVSLTQATPNRPICAAVVRRGSSLAGVLSVTI